MSQHSFGAKGKETVSQYLRRTQGRNRHRLPYDERINKKPTRPQRGTRTDHKWNQLIRGRQLIELLTQVGLANESN